jgi:hypothetical protein
LTSGHCYIQIIIDIHNSRYGKSGAKSLLGQAQERSQTLYTVSKTILSKTFCLKGKRQMGCRLDWEMGSERIFKKLFIEVYYI